MKHYKIHSFEWHFTQPLEFFNCFKWLHNLKVVYGTGLYKWGVAILFLLLAPLSFPMPLLFFNIFWYLHMHVSPEINITYFYCRFSNLQLIFWNDCCFLRLGKFEVSETKSDYAKSQAMNPPLESLFRMVQEFYFRALVHIDKDPLPYKENRSGSSLITGR